MMNHHSPAPNVGLSRDFQQGFALLESLVALLIFSLGILTVLSLQATSIKVITDAKYRTEAALLANRVIGQMWASSSLLTQLKTDFETGGTAYANWLAEVEGAEGLPGVAAPSGGRIGTRPTITFNTATSGANAGQVTVTIFWRPPGTPDSERRQHTVVAQIVRN